MTLQTFRETVGAHTMKIGVEEVFGNSLANPFFMEGTQT